MKNVWCSLVVVLVLIVGGGAMAQVQITIYNDNLALVKETRPLKFKKGIFELPFTGVAAAIDPTSVALTVKENADLVTLLEQDFRYDLVSSEKILSRYLDRTIRVISKNEKLHEGALLAADPNALTLRRADGGITIINRAEVAELSFPDLPEGLMTRPTLIWLLDSQVDGVLPTEVRYLTGRVSWHAEYIATVNDAGDQLELAGWVSIDNKSGVQYSDAAIKLVAGDVHRVQDKLRTHPMMAMESRSGGAFEEREFFEYHLYSLGRSATLHDNEIKQLSLFEPATVKAQTVYTFDGARQGSKVRVSLEFENSTEAGLGMPLPAGKVRAMKADVDGSLEFIGEDAIDHTPKNEHVRVYMGNAFDIVGERRVIDRRQISNRVTAEDIEIVLRNHKSEPVTIVVVEHFWGDWSITSASSEVSKKDARTGEWRLTVPAGGSSTLSFTVRRRS
jgi:hypothetical protein